MQRNDEKNGALIYDAYMLPRENATRLPAGGTSITMSAEYAMQTY